MSESVLNPVLDLPSNSHHIRNIRLVCIQFRYSFFCPQIRLAAGRPRAINLAPESRV